MMLRLDNDEYKKYIELVEKDHELGHLPLPIEEIIALEAQGHVVDLITGEIILKGSDQRVALTVIGEAVAVAAKAWGGNV